MSARRPWEVQDAPWERIKPLLPRIERSPGYPGRPRVDGCKAAPSSAGDGFG